MNPKAVDKDRGEPKKIKVEEDKDDMMSETDSVQTCQIFPSDKEIQLQEKLTKTEEKLQRAYRAAAEHKLRADLAEERLDSKYGIKENFESEKKRADELEKKLKDESRKVSELTRKLAQYEGRTQSVQKSVAVAQPAEISAKGGLVKPRRSTRPAHSDEDGGTLEKRKKSEKRSGDDSSGNVEVDKSRRLPSPAMDGDDFDKEDTSKDDSNVDHYWDDVVFSIEDEELSEERTEDRSGNDSPERKERPTRNVRKPISYKEPVVDDEKIDLEWYCDGAACAALNPPPPLSASTGHYKCWECSDYDLCTDCKEKGEHSQMHHVLKEIIKKMKMR